MKYANKKGKVVEGTSGYEIVAEARGLTVIKYESFGSYQGEWIMLARNKKKFYIFKDSFGSCSYCDHYQSTFDDYGSEPIYPWEKVEKFINEFKPFLEIPEKQFMELYRTNSLLSIFPANMNDKYSEIDLPAFVTSIKLEEVKHG
jgi:hypothetical protein